MKKIEFIYIALHDFLNESKGKKIEIGKVPLEEALHIITHTSYRE